MSQLVDLIDASTLSAIAPRAPADKAAAQKSIIANFGSMLPQILAVAQATTALRIVHFLAQVGHESDGFCAIEEYASGRAYEGRTDLGNIYAGDGVKFKGRSPTQLTGRDNYRRFTKWMRARIPDCPDFEKQPELVATWPWAGWAVAFFWDEHPKINAAADADDLVGATKAVNGGKNGLPQRGEYLSKAKVAVARLQSNVISAEQQFATLHRGMTGQPIEMVQRQLSAAGFYFLSIDGDFGAGTEGAVKTFQRSRQLTADGIVGAKTAAALAPFTPKEA